MQTIAAALALPIAVSLILWRSGIDVLQPIRLQGALANAGNIPYLCSFVPGSATVTAAMQLAAVAVVGLLCLYWISRPAKLSTVQIVLGMVLFTLVCPLAYKKFSPNYLMMVFMPLCAVAALDRNRTAAAIRFAVLNLVITMENSLWFRMLHGEENHSWLWQLIPRMRASHELANLWMFVAVDLTLLGCYVLYLRKTWGLLHSSLATQPPPGDLSTEPDWRTPGQAAAQQSRAAN